MDLTAFCLQIISFEILNFGIAEVYYALMGGMRKERGRFRIGFLISVFLVFVVYILALANVPTFSC